MGILIPLYTYPTDATWVEVARQASSNPAAKVIVVINPDNGVGMNYDTLFKGGTQALKLAGVTILGYVATDYGRRALADVSKECAQYVLWYSVDGIFFDEYQSGWQAPSVPGILLGNPGTDATGNIALVTYEQAGMPPIGFQGNYIAHTVGALPPTYPKPSYYYITDDPATYQRLPSYFASLVAGDAGIVAGNPPVPPPPGKTMKLTIGGKTYSWPVT